MDQPRPILPGKDTNTQYRENISCSSPRPPRIVIVLGGKEGGGKKTYEQRDQNTRTSLSTEQYVASVISTI